MDVLRIYDKLFFFFYIRFLLPTYREKRIFREYGFRVTNSINCELISSLNFNLEIREESNEEVNKQINKIRNLITNLIKINLETLDKRTITIFKRIIAHIAFSLCRCSPSPHFDKEKISQFRDRFHCWGTVSMTETKRGKRTSNGKHWSRKGDRSRKKTSRRSVHLSREPCLEQGLPSPKTRSSSRPPPKNPRMDEIKRAVRSSFSPPLLSRSPSSCLFACLFADSDHWAFLGETVPCFLPVFLRSRGKRKK